MVMQVARHAGNGVFPHKNAVHTMAMNLLVYPVGIVGFWLSGFALMYGGVAVPSLGPGLAVHRELNGWSARARSSRRGQVRARGRGAKIPRTWRCSVATVFMDTAATVPTGALVERWKLSAFMIYGLFMSMLLYPIYGNWFWGAAGWRSWARRSVWATARRFRGLVVVHMTGGVTAWAVAGRGPRIGKFRRDGTISVIPGHNLPMAMIGTGILAFGWFGFNAGSRCRLAIHDRA